MYVHACICSSCSESHANEPSASLSPPKSLLHDSTCPVRLLCHWDILQASNNLINQLNKKFSGLFVAQNLDMDLCCICIIWEKCWLGATNELTQVSGCKSCFGTCCFLRFWVSMFPTKTSLNLILKRGEMVKISQQLDDFRCISSFFNSLNTAKYHPSPKWDECTNSVSKL